MNGTAPGAGQGRRRSIKRPYSPSPDDGAQSAQSAQSRACAHNGPEVRIGMWQRSTRRKLAGKMAPLKSELLKFLAEHTDCEVYTGQDLQKSGGDDSAGRVAVWHKANRTKLSGKQAPEPGNLLQWLQKHPEYEVFCGQTAAGGAGAEAQSAAASDGPANERVEIWNRKLGRRLAGNVAPLRKNLDKYLQKYPECEVYDGQEADESGSEQSDDSDDDEASSSDDMEEDESDDDSDEGGSSDEGSEESDDDDEEESESDEDQKRCVLWNTATKKKITGNNAPMQKNLAACLKRHPEYELYSGQDGNKKSKSRKGGGKLARRSSKGRTALRAKSAAGVVTALKTFARMGTFEFAGNDLLVVRTEDPDSPVPYYLGMVPRSHKKRARRESETLSLQWLMPDFTKPARRNPASSKKIATAWEDGCSVLMRFDDMNWYHGVATRCDGVKRVCDINFDDGDRQRNVSFDDQDVVLISEHPFRQTISLKDADRYRRSDGYKYKLHPNKSDQVGRDCVLCRMRILTPVELKEQRLRVSTREHERIMDMLLENEAAIEKVWSMQVDGPATGMEQVDCVQLDEIVLEQSGVQSVTSASGGGGGASPRGAAAPSPREAPLGKNGRDGKAAAQEWALGAMPVQPVPCAGLGKQSGRFGIGEGHMKPKDSPRGYLDISEVGLGENLGGKGGPGAAADGNLVEVDFFDQF